MTSGSAITMSTLITSITTIFSGFLGMVSDTVDAITGSPLLLLAVLLPVCFGAVGLVKRLISINA